MIFTTSLVVAPTFKSPPSIHICRVLCPIKKSAMAGSTVGVEVDGVTDGTLSGIASIPTGGLIVGLIAFLPPLRPSKVGTPKSSKNPIGIPPKYLIPSSSYSKSDASPHTLIKRSTRSAEFSSTCSCI